MQYNPLWMKGNLSAILRFGQGLSWSFVSFQHLTATPTGTVSKGEEKSMIKGWEEHAWKTKYTVIVDSRKDWGKPK